MLPLDHDTAPLSIIKWDGTLEKLVEEKVAKGVTREEARYAALRELGGVEQIKEECRDARGVSFIEATLKDVRYGGAAVGVPIACGCIPGK